MDSKQFYGLEIDLEFSLETWELNLPHLTVDAELDGDMFTNRLTSENVSDLEAVLRRLVDEREISHSAGFSKRLDIFRV